MRVAQPADQSESESGPGAVATDRNMSSSDTFVFARIAMQSARHGPLWETDAPALVDRVTASVRILAARPTSVIKRRWLWIEPEQ